jgi:hypothetical protein
LARTILEQTLPDAHVNVHHWTGRNRVLARREAATSLLNAVTGSAAARRDRYIVAHSHGGNIAVLADALRPGVFKGIVTLNTPFLELSLRNSLTVFLHLACLYSGLVVLLCYAVPMGPLGEIVFGGAVWSLGGFAIYYLTQLAAAHFPKEHDTFLRRQMGMGIREDDAPVLALNSPDDEAYAWLSVAGSLTEIPYLLLHPILIVLSILACAGIFVALDVPPSRLATDWFWGLVTADSFAELLLHQPYPPASRWDLYEAVVRASAMDGVDFFIYLASAVEYLVLGWAAVAALAFVASYLTRGLVLGASLGLGGILEALFLRQEITPAPLNRRNTVEYRSMEGLAWKSLKHSGLHGDILAWLQVGHWLQRASGSQRSTNWSELLAEWDKYYRDPSADGR